MLRRGETTDAADPVEFEPKISATNFEAMDSMLLAAFNAADAVEPYQRLGLRRSPGVFGEHAAVVGNESKHFGLEFIEPAPAQPLTEPLGRALTEGRGVCGLALRVADLDAALSALAGRGIAAIRQSIGATALAWLPLHEQAGTDIVLVQHQAEAVKVVEHAFPLRRLDHLAAVCPDLEAKTRFWLETLGVPVAGEVVTPTLVIRQFRIGDAVLELLGPASPESPIWKRTPGLVGLASWEVADLDEAVRLARIAGFTVPEPTLGALPGTRIATISGAELAGVNMQLLQYV